jgi:6-pyruvoyltetrahydropterin/6-carboxytetrahydropterin synthase
VITVTRRYSFCASHRLHVNALNDAQNDELFGKCNNPFGHGHNYEIEISVSGPIDVKTGRAVDLRRLDKLVGESVVSRFDHRYLNEEVPEFAHIVPTTENLANEIRRNLDEAWRSEFPSGLPELRRIRIFETERNIIEVAIP